MQIIQGKNSTLLIPSDSVLLPKNNADSDSDANHKRIDKYFNAAYWMQSNQIVGESIGRNTTYFIQSELSETLWVLRHYYRGGMMAKLIKDRYLFSSIEETRVFKEIALLEAMIKMELPVPKPVGGRITLAGGFYRADLLMEKIEAKDLVACLKTSSLSEGTWRLLGRTIANFHKNNVHHSDLNAHNILLGSIDNKVENQSTNTVWIIDFDQCEIMKTNGDWRLKNIQRLKRSFDKESSINEQFNYSEKDWSLLLEEYSLSFRVS